MEAWMAELKSDEIRDAILYVLISAWVVLLFCVFFDLRWQPF